MQKKYAYVGNDNNNILVNKIAWDTTILRIFLYLNVHIQEQYRPFHCTNNNHSITEP